MLIENPFKNSIALSILLMLAVPCSAQKIWFEDTFKDNSKGWLWSDYDGPEVTRKLGGGTYTIHHKKDQIYWTLIPIYSDRNKDFSWDSNIIQQEGNPSNGFGLLVAGSNSKYFYFMINPVTGMWWAGTEQKGTWSCFNASRNWEPSPAIHSVSMNNRLELQRKDDKLLFRVNETALLYLPIYPLFKELVEQDYYGIVTCAPMKIEVEDFTFRQDNVLNLVPNLPRGLQKINLGPAINSSFSEKTPVVSPDGKTLFFSVQGDPGSVAGSDDIYFSSALTDTTWNPKVKGGFPINNAWPNSVISVSPDNNNIVLMHTYNADGSPKGAGISVATKTREGWSVPRDITIDNYYNKGGSNEFCMSANREVLLMTIQRDDSHGSNDAYVSFLKEDGSYSEPMNLGTTVNSSGWEASPFLAADNVSLYFATNGHPGYGSADIFVTKRLDSTWTKWSSPQNLGPDINSSGWEAYFTLPASGRYAYVVSEKKSLGGIDIFRVTLPEALKPRPVVMIYGKVLNSKTKEPLEATIQYNDLTTNKQSGLAVSNVKDGSYKIVLTAGEAYSFLAKKENYYSVSENIDVQKLSAYQEIERNLYLAPIDVGETILLNNLFFDFNRSNLRKESAAELDRMVALLQDRLSMMVEIVGHTDNVGSDAYNQTLSVNRAEAVKEYLFSKGIQSDRIQVKGYGKTKPSGSNDTEEGRQQNRRVEFTILKN